MVEVYYYIPAAEVVNAVECGLKLSVWFDKEVRIGHNNKKCMSALLNPKDDLEKYHSEELRCVKFDLHRRYCYVADRYLYEMGIEHPEIMRLYLDSVMPIENYVFGLYRMPECLITCTVIGEQISLLKKLDSPVIVASSEELYLNNIIEAYKEEQPNFNDILLYHFYCSLVESGKLEKIEDEGKDTAVFLDNKIGRAYIIKKPSAVQKDNII
ncbi:MAG: hypothetical protein GX992_01125 [Clostridium sp.]|nr:hypothetical protein [Clostridium sp.]